MARKKQARIPQTDKIDALLESLAVPEPPFEAKHYPPRFSTYSGTKRQLLAAAVLPSDFAFPTNDDGEPAFRRWACGQFEYCLRGKYLSQKHMNEGKSADYWWLSVIDTIYKLSDNLVDIRRAELEAATTCGVGSGRGSLGGRT